MRASLPLVALSLAIVTTVFLVHPGSSGAQGSLPPNPVGPPQLPLPANQPERGLIFDGLEIGAVGSCPGALHVRGTSHCTHGPDAAPAGVDVRAKAPQAVSTVSAQAAAVQCDGDGTSGNRTEVLYVRGADRADAFSTYQASFQQWAADADAIYQNSALKTGGARRLRFVHDASCNVIVRNVALSASGNISFNTMVSGLQAQGYDRTDRKYMIFMDASVYCGIGSLWGDDSPAATNANNRGASYARADRGCWDGGTIAHESMHNMGGVQRSAPHSTYLQNITSSNTWHCSDEYDRMCYADASGVTMTYPCASSNESLFDCNDDDYFHTSPPAGSYLSNHWNTASNQFLIAGAGTPPPPTGSVHVSDLDGSTSTLNKNNWRATVTIRLTDGSGQPVSSATVNGVWSGVGSGGTSCTTAPGGTCTLTSGNINVRTGSVILSVSSVAHATLSYNPLANTDLDGDSNGTVISISKP